MAIKKIVELPSKVSADYHRIDQMAWNKSNLGFSVHGLIGMYLTKGAAADGAQPLTSMEFSVTLPPTVEPTMAAVYALLTAPVEYHEYQDTENVRGEDGSFGPVAVTRSVVTESSVTGLNDGAMV